MPKKAIARMNPEFADKERREQAKVNDSPIRRRRNARKDAGKRSTTCSETGMEASLSRTGYDVETEGEPDDRTRPRPNG